MHIVNICMLLDQFVKCFKMVYIVLIQMCVLFTN